MRRLNLFVDALESILMYYERVLLIGLTHDGSRLLGERRVPPEQRLRASYIKTVHEHVTVQVLDLDLLYLAHVAAHF